MDKFIFHNHHSKDSKVKSEVNENGVGAFSLRRKSGSNSMMSSSYLPPMGMPLSRFVRGC